MTWICRFLEKPSLRPLMVDGGLNKWSDGTLDFDKFAVGDMAFYHYKGAPCTDQTYLAELSLTQHYRRVNAHRPPLVCCLPGHVYFLVDGQCYSSDCTRCKQKREKCTCGDTGLYTPRGYYDGWTVEGVAPLITVVPSINYEGTYHGFLQNGVIGDDVEKRKF